MKKIITGSYIFLLLFCFGSIANAQISLPKFTCIPKGEDGAKFGGAAFKLVFEGGVENKAYYYDVKDGVPVEKEISDLSVSIVRGTLQYSARYTTIYEPGYYGRDIPSKRHFYIEWNWTKDLWTGSSWDLVYVQSDHPGRDKVFELECDRPELILEKAPLAELAVQIDELARLIVYQEDATAQKSKVDQMVNEMIQRLSSSENAVTLVEIVKKRIEALKSNSLQKYKEKYALEKGVSAEEIKNLVVKEFGKEIRPMIIDFEINVQDSNIFIIDLGSKGAVLPKGVLAIKDLTNERTQAQVLSENKTNPICELGHFERYRLNCYITNDHLNSTKDTLGYPREPSNLYKIRVYLYMEKSESIMFSPVRSTPRSIVKATDIRQWGDVEFESYNMFNSMGYTDRFRRIDVLECSAQDAPKIFGNAGYMRPSPKCNFKNWDTSRITNMWGMFYDTNLDSPDLSAWDTSNVTNMKEMFALNPGFNSDISNWDTRNVKDMSGMFNLASSFNSDLSKWNTSNVSDMNEMFKNSKKFNADISRWDTSNVTDMSFMFERASSFNQDLSQWNTKSTKTHREFSIEATNWTLPKPSFF